VRRLLVEETLPIDRELYLAILVDRAEGKPLVMASASGGMEIEQVAEENPDAIIKEHIDPAGMAPFQARKIAFALGLQGRRSPMPSSSCWVYRAFTETDASMLEINPLITTKDGRLFALDAKITFDDNALFRHADLKELRDITEEDPLEVEASKYSLNYIKLEAPSLHGERRWPRDGDDGHHQVRRRNAGEFSRRGRGANEEQVGHAFEILLSDKSVKAVLINIFADIARRYAGQGRGRRGPEDQLEFARSPAVGRHERGRRQEILMESGLNFIVADAMKDAAER